MKPFKKYYPYGILLAVVLLSYWRVTFLHNSFRGDMIDCFFPWRFYISECFSNGTLPLWNPFQHLGYPMHADPQSSFWYPVTWFMAYFFSYNVYTIHLEFLATILIGGIGFYELTKRFNVSKISGLFAAIAYVLCGFFVGNAQHFSWVIAGAWLPWIVHYFLATLEHPHWKSTLKLVLVTVLFITGGYPIFLYLFAFIAAGVFINYSIKHWKTPELKQVLIHFAVATGLIVVLCLGYLQSFIEAKHLITRGEGIPLSGALMYPFSLQSFFSLLMPFTVTTDFDFFATNPTMANGYIGLIVLIFVIADWFNKPKKLHIILYAIALLFLLAGLGDQTPVREWLYKSIPGMDQFRYPGIFRVFFMACFILVAALNFNALGTRKIKNLKIVTGFFILLLGIIYVIASRTTGWEWMSKMSSLFDIYNHATLEHHFALNSIIQFGILVLFWAALYFIKNILLLKRTIVGLVVLEMFIATNLNMTRTVVNPISGFELQHKIDRMPQGFGLAENKKLADMQREPIYNTSIWQNTGIWRKRPSLDGNNPFMLNTYGAIKADTTNLNKTLATSSKGTPITITAFTPNKIVLQGNFQQGDTVSLYQNNYPHWEATTPNAELTLNTQTPYLSTVLPHASNEVVFSYRPTATQGLFWWSVISFLMLCVSTLLTKSRLLPKRH